MKFGFEIILDEGKVNQMTDVAAEFPFVSEVTRQRSSPQAWEQLGRLRAILEAGGAYVPIGLARRLLGLSKQRVYTLIEEGLLETIDVGEHKFVTETSLVAYARSERKAGRPAQARTVREALKAAREWAKENS